MNPKLVADRMSELEKRKAMDAEYCPKYTHDEAIAMVDILELLCAAHDRFWKLNVNRMATGTNYSFEFMGHVYSVDGHLKQAIDELCKFMRDEQFFDDGKEEGSV